MSEQMAMFFVSRGWPADEKLAFCCAMERARREILEDVLSGRVPFDVGSFAQLHDHVDANEYGWGFDQPIPLEDERVLRFCNLVQEKLDQWIASGGMAAEAQKAEG